ncbi:AMP-binding protein [Desulfurobacterium atlanticum]|uniref:AMP-binding enzyme n=1 Tax=Desulfurobacterium atlanticum TaxID=240169 RepID=A0A238XI05_9BACT|nr:AMP-binding protein [Desulfurobacterium atlanticum]SNR58567.1 AMP-binding enzyme [Desulfurobacterium atlanticum]
MFLEDIIENFDKKGDKEILVEKKDGKYSSITFSEFKKLVSSVQKELGDINKEDRVVIFMENSPLWIASLFAVMFSGGISVPVDYLLSESEFFNILRDAQPRVILTSTQNYDKAKLAAKKLGYKPEIVKVDNVVVEDRELKILLPSMDDVAVILYTSGTTGNPKGVMLTYRNLNHNIEGIRDIRLLNEKDRFIAILPFHHTYPLLATVVLPITEGLPLVFIERLTPADILSTIRDQNVTIMVGVPKLFQVIYHNI